MTIYEFDWNIGNKGQEELQNFVPKPKEDTNPVKKNDGYPGNHDSRDIVQKEWRNIDDPIDVNFVEEIRESYVPGFYLLDKGVKNYFSGIRIPRGIRNTEDYRMLNVRIAEADSSALVYADRQIRGGRLQLPILAITRTNEEYDNKRFSPAHHPIFRRLRNNGKKMELVYRPVPYNLSYTLDIWGEHKSDVEWAIHSIVSRFNPTASFYLEEPKYGVSFEVVMMYNGTTNTSDLETDAESHEEVRRSVTIKVEGWLPQPTKIIPTVLAKPQSIKEAILNNNGDVVASGETFAVIRDRPIPQRRE